MLLLATVGWGFSFTWAKSSQEATNHCLGLPPESAMGPVLTLGVRYTLAGILLLVLAARTRRGWSGASVRRALSLGLLLGGALALQHLGLSRTSEAVSAFLSSLSILIVPLIMAVVFRKPPERRFWFAALLATAGVWLMTGATPTGFGIGEALGLACAGVFSVYLLAINTLVARDDPWRMVCGQFLFLGLLMLLVCWWISHGQVVVTPGAWGALLRHGAIWLDILLLLLFSTILPYLLMSVYQPKIDPTRAALIYLFEPIVAAAFAYVARGRVLGTLELAGVSLILFANALIELLSVRPRRG